MCIRTPLKRLLLTAVMLLGVGGCSNLQIGYNYADTFSLYYLDGYLDLTPAQEQKASAGLQRLFAWHRQNELPAYARELAAAQQFMLGQLTLEQVAGLNAFMRASLERTALQATPMLSELLLSLTPAQVTYLREQLEQSNAEFREEYLAGDERQQRYQLLQEQFEDWFGELDPQQLAVLRVTSADWPVDNRFWYDERLIRQQEMLDLVDYAVGNRPEREQLDGRLQQYIRGFEHDRQAKRQATIEQSREHAMRLIVALAARGTDEQKRNAVARAQGLIDDFSVLLAER